MSDEQALLAAIRDNLEEDTPRLMYADWLEERGGEGNVARAEFIRVQCERSNLYGARDEAAEQYAQLGAREKELVAKYAKQWLAEFPQVAVDEDSFARGFLSSLELNARRCSKTPRPPWYREPVVTVNLTGTGPDVRKLCEKGWLDFVLELDLRPSKGNHALAVAEAVAESTCAHTLRKLSLWDEGYGDSALGAIAEGDFRELRELSCNGQFTPVGWEGVLNAPAASRLEQLTVGHRGPWQTTDQTRPGPGLAEVLASAPILPQLKFLWLSGCGLNNAGLTRFLTRGRFTRLETLNIDGDGIGPTATRALVAAELPALTSMRLGHCQMNDAAGKVLVTSDRPVKLERLDLSLNNFTAATAKAIARSRRARKLKYLDLGCNAIGDAGVVALMESQNFVALEELFLSSAGIGNAGADAVLGSKWAGKLKTIFMSYNSISGKKQAELTAKFGSKLWIDGVVDD